MNRISRSGVAIAMIALIAVLCASASGATTSAEHKIVLPIGPDGYEDSAPRINGINEIILTISGGQIYPSRMRTTDRRPRTLRGGLSNPYVLVDSKCEEVAPDILHYEFILKVGVGEHDKIGLHLVTTPERASVSSFWIPGSSLDFESNYLVTVPDNPEYVPPAILMAESGIDVWGISPRHSFVDESEKNLTFMKNWTENVYLRDEELVISVAEYYNELIASIYRDEPIPLVLGGHSQGARHAAIIASERDDIDGLILLDMPGPLDPERDADVIAMANATYNSVAEDRTNGTYHDASMLYFQQMMQSANEQTILYALIYTKELGEFMYYQGYCAGDMANGLYFTNLSTMFAMTEAASPYQPNALNLAVYGQWAGILEYQIPYNQIKCPVLNIEAGLGMGDRCDPVAKQIAEGGNLFATTIRLESQEHADLITANNAWLWEGYLLPSMISLRERN